MPPIGRPMPTYRLYRQAAVVGSATGIAHGIQAGLSLGLPPVVAAMGEALARRKIPDDLMLRTNLRIASAAQDAVVAGLSSRLPRNSPPYRPGPRLTGRLEPALKSHAMLQRTSPRLISFINKRVLDEEARHWYRINYGATGELVGPGNQPATFTLAINGVPVMTLRDARRPVTGTIVPIRYVWIGPEFVPRSSETEHRADIGTRAAQFVDLGLAVVANRVGPDYMRMFRDYIATDAGKRRMARNRINVGVNVRLQAVGYSVDVTLPGT